MSISNIYQANIKNRLYIFAGLLVFSVIFGANVNAQSQQQINQFLALPPAQQEALARQLGVDLNSLQQPSSSQQPQISEPLGEAERQSLLSNDETLFNEDSEEPSSDESDQDELKPFGYELFNQPSYSFAPATDIPIPADYVMGPGDTLIIQLYGKENASYSLVVNREGQIQFPEIGPINLAGLKFSRAQEIINQIVSEQMIGVKSSVTSGALRSIRVFVLGEAQHPGSYTVSSLSTMTNALFASGGVNNIGSLRRIQLKRSGQLITELDLYDLLLNGDTSKDQRLLPGDVIFIPTIGKTASVDGEVKRPAVYELKTESTLNELVNLAGGYLPSAYLGACYIERIDNQGSRTVVDVNLNTREGNSSIVKAGDALTVTPVLETLENVVYLEGHVKRPGKFSWKHGLKVVDLITSVYALKPNPDLNTALIIRETQPERKKEVIYINLQNAITSPNSPDNLQLKPRDEIRVFGFEEDRGESITELIETLKLQANKFDAKKIVTVRGLVRYPAEYPLQKGLTLTQLVYAAGGLLELAYGLEAEVTRYNYADTMEQEIEHFAIPLNGPELNSFILQASDSVTIKQIPNYSSPEVVTIEGEVLFPGEYTIRKGETLASVLKRAGGVTKYANPKGAVFTRLDLKELEKQRIKELRETLELDLAASNLETNDLKNNAANSDVEQLLEDLEEVEAVGRLVIDLPSIINNASKADVRLTNGDRLIVPPIQQSIAVVGEVQFPTSHLYEENLSVKDYLSRSGGINERADKSRIYVVKANGRVFLPGKKGWFRRDNVTIEAGDTVVVPIDTDRIESLTLWSSVSQIIYQIALGAAAVNSF